MSEWKKVRLGEIANYVNEKIDIKAFDTSLYISTDSMLKDKGGIGTPESIPESGKVTKYQHNDILVSNIRPYFKKIWFSNREGGCSNDVLVFRANDNIDSTFLYYVLSDDSFFDHMMSSANGTKMPRGNRKLIPSFEIPLPPLHTQHRIANILSRYDSLIENYQKQIKLLEEAAQRLYKEWFVDLRFPGHENTNIIDGVPEGWEKKKAIDFFEMSIGKTPPRAEKQWFTDGKEGVPWVSISDMKDVTYLLQTSEGLTKEACEKHNVRIVDEGTVLLSFKLTVGRVSIAGMNVCTNEAIAHFNKNGDDWREYTLLYLRNYNFDTLGNTSGISKAVNSTIVKNMPFLMPSGKFLDAFSNVAKPLFQKIKNLSFQLRLLTEARDRLLPKLMSGEIEI